MNEESHAPQSHLTCSIDPDLRLATLTFVGDWPSFAAMQHALDTLVADPVVGPGFSVLIDHSALTTAHHADNTRRAVEMIARVPSLRDLRWAGLAASNNSFAVNGRVAMAIAAAQGVQLRVFTNRSEAMNWLLHASAL
jgi:hypothetical protein